MAYGNGTNLIQALHGWIKNGVVDGLYMVSMDHSPGEQLTGHVWHTTVLVVSAALEHAELANRVGLQLRSKTSQLSKWSRTSDRHRRNFLPILMKELQQFPGVAILAISAEELTVKRALPELIFQLNLEARYCRLTDGTVSFGPFVRGHTGESITVQLSEKRAAMALFIAHFVKRMHQYMHEAANVDRNADPTLMNWSFYADKFPGATGSDMDLMFQILLGLDSTRGRIQWGYFKEGGKVGSDLLADNLAGALDDSVGQLNLPLANGGLFYWEQWRSES
jgi:hypothetical protein